MDDPTLSPVSKAAAESLLTTVAASQELLARRFVQALAPMVARMNALADGISQVLAVNAAHWTAAFEPLLKGLEQLRLAWEETRPLNWSGLTPTQFGDLVDIMEETGWCLVWVPRNEIILQLLQATNKTVRAQILIRHKLAIVEDLLACASEVSDPDLAEPADVFIEAIRTFASGHRHGAQALASAVLTSLVEDKMGADFSWVRREYKDSDPMSAPILHMRTACVLAALVKGIQRFEDVVPHDFNRNATAHRISSRQYTEANTISALLLCAALMMELQALSEAPSEEPPLAAARA